MAGDKFDLPVFVDVELPFAIFVFFGEGPCIFLLNSQLNPPHFRETCPRSHNNLSRSEGLHPSPEKVLTLLYLQRILESPIFLISKGLSEYCHGEVELLDFLYCFVGVEFAACVGASAVAVVAVVDGEGGFGWAVLLAGVCCCLQLREFPVIVGEKAVTGVEELKVVFIEGRLPGEISVMLDRIVPH